MEGRRLTCLVHAGADHARAEVAATLYSRALVRAAADRATLTRYSLRRIVLGVPAAKGLDALVGRFANHIFK